MATPEFPGNARNWGCLGSFLLGAGLLSLFIYQAAGGTMVEVEYRSIAAAIVGGIVLLVLVQRRLGVVTTRPVHLPKWAAMTLAALVGYFLIF